MIVLMKHLMAITLLAVAGAASAQTFEDVTAEVGLSGMPVRAVGWGDFNSDGWVDFYTVGQLYRNDKGKFVAMKDHGMSGETCVWADYDNDGRLDAYMWLEGKLYRNIDGTRFEDIGVKLPPRPQGSSRGACWGDFDADGHVDLYVGGWEEPSYQTDCIYRNNGDGTFAMHWKQQGRMRPARGVTAADFDADGDLDVYVSNYRLEQNLLWLNDGKGAFTEVAAERNVAGIYGQLQAWGHAIGSAFGDFDGDGLFDLFIGNFSHPAAYQDRPQFMRNMGEEHGYKFEDMSAKAALKWQESFATPTLGDYDNDGDLDIYFTTVYSGDHCVLLRNDGAWTFTDVTKEAGIVAATTYQAAWADYDNDGDLDLITDTKLYRNPGNEHHWLKVRCIGGGKVNRAAIGTVVTVRVGDKKIIRQVEGGMGEGSQNDLTLHFGLGAHRDEVEMNVRWPDGAARQLTTNVDRLVAIERAP